MFMPVASRWRVVIHLCGFLVLLYSLSMLPLTYRTVPSGAFIFCLPGNIYPVFSRGADQLEPDSDTECSAQDTGRLHYHRAILASVFTYQRNASLAR